LKREDKKGEEKEKKLKGNSGERRGKADSFKEARTEASSRTDRRAL
jgi:hypothetical protein